MRTVDYILLPLGTEVDYSEIQLCPHCGKRGLAEKVNGDTFYTHLQVLRFDENSRPDFRWEWCPKPAYLSQETESK